MVDYRRSGGAAEWHGRARGKSTPPRLFYLSLRCKSAPKKLSGTSPAVFRAIALHSRSVRYAHLVCDVLFGLGSENVAHIAADGSSPVVISSSATVDDIWRDV